MIAILCATFVDGSRFVEEHALDDALLVTRRNHGTARGRILTAAYETPAFRAAVSDLSQQIVRESVAPAMCTTGGQFIAPKE